MSCEPLKSYKYFFHLMFSLIELKAFFIKVFIFLHVFLALMRDCDRIAFEKTLTSYNCRRDRNSDLIELEKVWALESLEKFHLETFILKLFNF